MFGWFCSTNHVWEKQQSKQGRRRVKRQARITHKKMRLAGHHRHSRLNIISGCRPLHHRQQHQHQQKSRNHIRRHLHLIPLRHPTIQSKYRRISQQHIQPLQLGLSTPAKRPHTFKRAQIQRPHLDNRRSRSRSRSGGSGKGPLDVGLGRLAALGAPAGEDQAGGAQAGKVAGCFEAEAAVGPGHDDGAAGVGGGGRGDGAQLAAEEVIGVCESGWGDGE